MTVSIKERPILFSAPMVRAILDGRKSQTRRVVKPQFDHDAEPCEVLATTIEGWADYQGHSGLWAHEGDPGETTVKFQYGKTGDRLWVREAWKALAEYDHLAPRDIPVGTDISYPATYDGWVSRGRPSIHMPRWSSRILLEIVRVRVERLQDISEADAVAEGCPGCLGPNPDFPDEWDPTPQEEFCDLWKTINGAESWNANPWVWVVEFKRVTP